MAVVFPLVFVVVGAGAVRSGSQAQSVRAEVDALLNHHVEVQATDQTWVSEGSATCASRCSRYTFTLQSSVHTCIAERSRDAITPTLYVNPDQPTQCTAGLVPAAPWLTNWGIPALGWLMIGVGLLLSATALTSAAKRAD